MHINVIKQTSIISGPAPSRPASTPLQVADKCHYFTLSTRQILSEWEV